MKLSKDDREYAAAVFYTHHRSLSVPDRHDELIRDMNRSFFYLSERVKSLVVRVIDYQYEQDFSVESCVRMLEKIARETVE